MKIWVTRNWEPLNLYFVELITCSVKWVKVSIGWKLKKFSRKKDHESHMNRKKISNFVNLLVQFYTPSGCRWVFLSPKAFLKIIPSLLHISCSCFLFAVHSTWSFKLHFILTWMYGKQLLLEESMEVRLKCIK